MFNRVLSKLLIASLLIAPIGLTSSNKAAIAGEVKQVDLKKTPINLAYGEGVTIALIDDNSVVKTVWLDNPSFAVLSFDKCVAGFNGCSESNAQYIHVKRIQDLKLKNIQPTNSTLMTVISENTETKDRDVHVFRIAKSNTSSSPLITVMPKSSKKQMARAVPQPMLSASGLAPEVLADKITATLANPQVKQITSKQERSKLKKFANLLMLGTAEYQAMNLYGVSPELIKTIVNFSHGVSNNET